MRHDDDVARRVGAAALATVIGLALLVWAACYEGALSDLRGEVMGLRVQLKDAEKDLAFWKPPVLA